MADLLRRAPFPFVKMILRNYGATIGDHCVIDTGMIIHRPDKRKPFKNLVIDENCYIGHDTIFDLSAKIHICHDVGIGAACQFWTHVGDFKEVLTNRIDDYHERVAEIEIGAKSIIYSGVIVSPGVKIEEYVRVAAGSVVNGPLPPHSLYGGVPARKIKDI